MYKRLLAIALALGISGYLLVTGYNLKRYNEAFVKYHNQIMGGQQMEALQSRDFLLRYGGANRERIRFNDSIGMLQNGQLLDAVESFIKVAEASQDRNLKADAFYNASCVVLDVAFKLKSVDELKRTAELLRETLRVMPNHWDAKWNYEIVMRLLEQAGMGKSGTGPGGNDSKLSPSPQSGEAGKDTLPPKL
ncbi:MAG: hypothetical protein Q7S36_03785 [Candidatus Liptonbacteria bacterium]|nr:hypothetical protein [Candidatus Liptonbacteria bacterium]